ncbi:MAG: class I SAM-dependent methyltransferase [Bacteroidetes bacterium]|nr:class I SAM-dependent methyltransferase [Bacteroidota bacterium]
MTSFKEKFYKQYVTTHNSHLYGQASLATFRSQFPVWKHYYQDLMPQDKDAVLLDLGCGNGGFVFFLQQLGYSNVRGVDLSAEQIEEGNGLGIKGLEVADIKQFLSTVESVDCVIARDVVEHFTRQEAFELLLLVVQKLKPGGRFIMQVPNGEGIFFSSIFYGDYTHEVAYSVSSVRQLFLNVGFHSSQCFPTGPVPHTLRGKLRYWLWALKVIQHRFWKMVETGNPAGIFTSNLIAVGIK